jgi:hypothetical protein
MRWRVNLLSACRVGAGSPRKEITMPLPRPLPPLPNLNNLRKQAKTLLAGWRSGDPEVLDRVRTFHPRKQSPSARPVTLADAQLVIARQYGFT